MSRHSTKRQSNLEIRTHHRLLPRKVADPDELYELLRKHNQLRQWANQPTKSNDLMFGKLLQMNYEALKLSHKCYSEKRRRKFERMTMTLRTTESNLIKKMKSKPIRETFHVERPPEQPSVIHRIFSVLKSLFCCNF